MSYLRADDPCEHVSRIDVIRAKLAGGDELELVMAHLDECRAEREESTCTSR